MPFNQHDLLRTAGYGDGDNLILPSFGALKDRTFFTTSTTYADSFNQFQMQVQWDDIYPADVQARVFFSFFLNPGTDETVDARLRNTNDNETVAELTGVTTSGARSLTTTYTPATTSATRTYRAQIRTNPGTNSSSIGQPVVSLGVLLE